MKTKEERKAERKAEAEAWKKQVETFTQAEPEIIQQIDDAGVTQKMVLDYANGLPPFSDMCWLALAKEALINRGCTVKHYLDILGTLGERMTDKKRLEVGRAKGFIMAYGLQHPEQFKSQIDKYNGISDFLASAKKE